MYLCNVQHKLFGLYNDRAVLVFEFKIIIIVITELQYNQKVNVQIVLPKIKIILKFNQSNYKITGLLWALRLRTFR